MALPTTQELTATLEKYVENVAQDNIFKTHSFWYEATKDGRQKAKQGGERLAIPIEYAKNTTVDGIGKSTRIPLVEQELLTRAEFNWKITAGAVTLFDADLLKNRGDAEVLDIMQANADNVISAFREELLTQTFATSQGANDLLNLQSVFRSTGTIGGISPTDFAGWAAYYNNTAEPLSFEDMETAYFTAAGTAGGPSAAQTVVTSMTLYQKYLSFLTPHYRTMDADLAKLGFETAKFHNANVIFDEQAISDEMWFINWNALTLYVQPEFKNGPKVEPFAPIPDQLGKASKIWWMGQWGVRNRRRLGCLDGRTA